VAAKVAAARVTTSLPVPVVTLARLVLLVPSMVRPPVEADALIVLKALVEPVVWATLRDVAWLVVRVSDWTSCRR
jgi:hypothetical protein